MRAFALIATLLLSPLAIADVAPPDSCGKAGDACSTAPPDYKSAGVCVKQTCSRRTPDGKSMQYDCNRCQPKTAQGKK